MEVHDYWQLECKNVPDRVSFMFQSGQWSDCKFLVGTESNQAVIEAHKMILAMASPVFEAMFYGQMAERNSPILIPDIQPATFKAMLKRSIYTMQQKYILPDVQTKCVKEVAVYIKQYSHICYICRAYEFATLFEEKLLINQCLEIMTDSTREVLTDSSFEDAQLSTVVAICSLKKINCTELALFDALERYVEAQKKRIESGTNRNNNSGPLVNKAEPKDMVVVDVESAENRPKTQDKGTTPAQRPTESKEIPNIRPALEKIRFLTLTAKEFAEGPAKSSLLTEHEVLAIFMNIASDKSHVPMPIGFSMYREER